MGAFFIDLLMKEKQLTEIIEPILVDMGYQLWGIEYLPQKGGALLRVYIDNGQGVTVEDCALCSREISAVLEVEDPISSAYTLEISSPGMDRLLFTVQQFQQFVGHQVRVKMAAPVNGARKVKGVIASSDTHEMRIIGFDDVQYDFDMNNVMSARLIAEFGDNKK